MSFFIRIYSLVVKAAAVTAAAAAAHTHILGFHLTDPFSRGRCPKVNFGEL